MWGKLSEFQKWVGRLLWLALFGVVAEFAIEWARAEGFYDDPVGRVHGLMNVLTPIVNNWWFALGLGATGGLYVALWLTEKFGGRVPPPEVYTDTRLRVRLDPAGTGHSPMKQSEEVMSNAELVKDLRNAAMVCRAFNMYRIAMSIDQGADALSSQDGVRDRALEEVAREVKARYSHEIGEFIRSLKSKPTTDDTEAQRQSWLRGEMAMGESVAGKPTTEERGTGGTQSPAPEVKQGLVADLQNLLDIDETAPVSYGRLIDVMHIIQRKFNELDTRLGGKNV